EDRGSRPSLLDRAAFPRAAAPSRLLCAGRQRRVPAPSRPALGHRPGLADARAPERAVRGLSLGGRQWRRLVALSHRRRRDRARRHFRERADRARHRWRARAPSLASDLAGRRPGHRNAARRPRRALGLRTRGGVGSTTARRAARRGRPAPDRRTAHHARERALHRQDRGPDAARGGRTRAGDAHPRSLAAPRRPRLGPGWDFSQGIGGLDVVDVGPHRLGGRLVYLPTRAVTCARWTGREMCWRHAPREYAAIHFHDDDVHDAGWATDFDFTVPEDLPSGAYVMRLAAGEQADELPFYVRPPRGRRPADLLFVASTHPHP